ncbi:hypothetical protein ILUMI_27421 [Ignelater luminosus]|uniref:Uncharacterized protein n=1 Tax=Ignelater luminosus TaxID=2038154 RepID=A0A8K0FXS7_IGNLU|nr:hypothetical protein ILUMI_27421 [Ignelater luminosus]
MMGSKCSYLLFIIWCTLLISSCRTHSHSHSHHDHDSHEPPSFKYSREANERAHHQAQHSAKHVHEEHKQSKQASNNDIWLYAMGSTLLISAAPVVILFVVPLDNTEQKKPLLKILLAFASGGLLGDAFLHLIPHATMHVDSEHDHSHTHSHAHEDDENHVHDMSVGFNVLCGILVFLLVEKSVRFIKGGHGHSHSKKEVNDKTVKKPEKKSEDVKKDESGDNKAVKEKKSKTDSNSESISHPEIKVAGYLNLAADFCHNFTDGLAIGASYLAGNSVGVVTTITILLHEVPHEIGDFAILVQSGVSKKNAMLLQLTTAVGALAGTALSLCAQDEYGLLAANWILPFTAGGFIYIALVSVIPELLEEEKPNLIQTILELLAMLGGVYMMVLIAKYE